MEINEGIKKFLDSAVGIASSLAEKMVEFTDQVAKKGHEFKNEKKEDFDKMFSNIKHKFEEAGKKIMDGINIKDKRVEEMEKRIDALEKEVKKLKKS